jgi:hypothetical protein
MAQQKVNLSKLRETNKQVAGYALLLLLASPAAHVLCNYTGLPANSLSTLFKKAKELIKDCLKPQHVRKSEEAQANVPNLPLPQDPALVTPAHASTAQSRTTASNSVDTSSFRSAKSLLQTTDPKKSKSTNTHKSNHGFSISTTSATPVGGARATAMHEACGIHYRYSGDSPEPTSNSMHYRYHRPNRKQTF